MNKQLWIVAALALIVCAVGVFSKPNFEKIIPGTNQKWRNVCRKPVFRREWRTLSYKEQKAYTDAINCLSKRKTITHASTPAARNRYDDFAGTHVRQTDGIHRVGHFLPWHRLMISLFEEHLHAECGYQGGIPYWDWSLDAGESKYAKSPVFGPGKNAFGGNGDYLDLNPNDTTVFPIPGRTGGGCVKDGAFKDFVVTLGPGNNITGNPRCLTRDLSPFLSELLNKEEVDKVLSATDYFTFDYRLQGMNFFNTFNVSDMGIHGAGHFAVGGSLGTMNNPYSSPCDPSFYLHHAQIDRIWWLWQKREYKKRLHEVSGPETAAPLFGPPPNPPAKNITLDFPIHLNELTSPWNITVRDMMDTLGGPLCYVYL
ncbi:hypothetical protein HK098_007778 [Nowakowskiella sp. JEL0407]|nr:hypothetical protein HK098_007778 [Nowakowskiella sp. JEL0407]